MTAMDKDSKASSTMSRGQFLGGSARVLGAAVIGGTSLSGLLAAGADAKSNAGSTRKGIAKLGASTVKIQESWLNNVEFAGLYAGIEKGYFTDAGIDLQILPGGTTIDPRSSVANGAATVGTVAVGTDVVLAVSQGADIQAFGAQYQDNPGCLMVHANAGINSIQDLKGKSIGLQNTARQQVQAILAHNGLTSSEVKLVIVGDDDTPFVLGKADAYTAFAFNEPVALAEKGIKTKCFSFSQIGLPAYGDVYIAQNSTITSQASMLAAFLGAARKGWEYTLAHPTEVTQLTLQKFAKDQDPKQQAGQMTVEIPMLSSAGTKKHGLLWMDPAVWTSSIQFMSNAKLLKKSVTASQVATDAILNRVK